MNTAKAQADADLTAQYATVEKNDSMQRESCRARSY
jgi:hypothetical protein